MANTILVLNAGSSSIKFQLFDFVTLRRALKGQIEGIGVKPRLKAVTAEGACVVDRSWAARDLADVPSALAALIEFLPAHLGGVVPSAVGHRVVHGGIFHSRPVRVTPDLVTQLEKLVPLAPLHQPNNLAPIRVILQRFPDLPQIACFDTAFHRGHPEWADRYAIPDELYVEGVRRYGFHGLSYEYVSGRLRDMAPDMAGGRVLIAHLGSGASMCALKNGRSIDSTMGFTALDGLPMGTRPGQIDPGIVLYLLREKGLTIERIENLLYRDCGLKALSGTSNDVRDLLASPEPRAEFALDYFVRRIAAAAGALAASLGGVDALVFTAGIGENSSEIRGRVCERLAWLGVDIDASRNETGGPLISTARSRISCYVIPTDEEEMIARHVVAALGPNVGGNR